MTPEIRKVETTVHETGVGVADRTDVSYELGATIGGAWVRFTSVSQSQVDAAVAAQPADTASSASSSASSPATTEQGPTMTDVTPTPAPQADAAASEQQQ